MCQCEDRPCCGHPQEERLTAYYADENDPYPEDNFYDYFGAQ